MFLKIIGLFVFTFSTLIAWFELLKPGPGTDSRELLKDIVDLAEDLPFNEEDRARATYVCGLLASGLKLALVMTFGSWRLFVAALLITIIDLLFYHRAFYYIKTRNLIWYAKWLGKASMLLTCLSTIITIRMFQLLFL